MPWCVRLYPLRNGDRFLQKEEQNSNLIRLMSRIWNRGAEQSYAH